jgi:hypothetical protein
MLSIFAMCCVLFFIGSSFGAAPAATIMPRYLVPLYTATPIIVHGLAGLWTEMRHRARFALGVCALIVVFIASISAPTLPPASPTAVAGAAPSPPPIDGLIRSLEAHKVRVVYTSYWLAYRITYESGEQVLGIPVKAALQLGQVRIPQDLEVAAHLSGNELAWVFDAGGGDEQAFRHVLRRRHVQAARLRWTTLAIYTSLSRALRAPVQL